MSFAALLRQLRTEAGLTQEELAQRSTLSPRSVSDLERGVAATTRRETARLLADALNLTGPARVMFEAAARGRVAAAEPPAAPAALFTVPSLRSIGNALPMSFGAYRGEGQAAPGPKLVRKVTSDA